jgi:Ca2+-binding EF-hand superfamily protein
MDETKNKLKKLAIYIGSASIATITLYFTYKYHKEATSKKPLSKPEDEHYSDLLVKLSSFYKEKQPKPHLILNNKQIIEEFFDKFDENKDGVINKIELHHLLDYITDKLNLKKPSQIEVLRFFDKIDTNRSGTISLEEFEEWMLHLTEKDFQNISVPKKIDFQLSDARNLFDEHDLDKNGYLDQYEYSIFLQDAAFSFHLDLPTEEKMKKTFEEIAVNGKINFEQFKKNLF